MLVEFRIKLDWKLTDIGLGLKASLFLKFSDCLVFTNETGCKVSAMDVIKESTAYNNYTQYHLNLR